MVNAHVLALRIDPFSAHVLSSKIAIGLENSVQLVQSAIVLENSIGWFSKLATSQHVTSSLIARTFCFIRCSLLVQARYENSELPWWFDIVILNYSRTRLHTYKKYVAYKNLRHLFHGIQLRSVAEEKCSSNFRKFELYFTATCLFETQYTNRHIPHSVSIRFYALFWSL